MAATEFIFNSSQVSTICTGIFFNRIDCLCAVSEGRDGMRLRNVGTVTVSPCNCAMVKVQTKRHVSVHFHSKNWLLSSLMANVL
jgi:hypothetical protein